MSDQSFSNQNDPYWLAVSGVNAVNFVKQSAPPLAYLNKGVLYELTDGKLYWNGQEVAVGLPVTGNVSGPGTSTVNAIPRWSNITGTAIKDSGILVDDSDNIEDVLSVTIIPTAANPGGTETLWINSVDGHLYKGAVDLEAGGTYPIVADVQYNTALGFDSLEAITTGDNNTALGYSAAELVSTGLGNVAIGYFAYAQSTAGTRNVAIGDSAMGNADVSGSYNIGLGFNALQSATTGSGNIAIGTAALDLLETGDYNVAIGHETLLGVFGATRNVAIGYRAGRGNAQSDCIAIGYDALFDGNGSGSICIGNYSGQHMDVGAGGNTCLGHETMTTGVTTGIRNVCVGYRAGKDITTAGDCIFVGNQAGESLTTGSTNMGIGYRSLSSNISAVDNTAVGYHSLSSSTTGTRNVALGHNAGKAITTAGNSVAIGYNNRDNAAASTGTGNVSIGSACFREATSANNDVAIGFESMNKATTAGSSVAVGQRSLFNVTTGNSNTCVGAQAGGGITTGDNNIAIGASSMNTGVCTGFSNIGIGNLTLQDVTSGYANTAIGYWAGRNITDGYENVLMGYNTGQTMTSGTLNTAVGNSSLSSTTFGSTNCCFGHTTGVAITTGQSNCLFGYSAGSALLTGDNNICIGEGAGSALLLSNNIMINNAGNAADSGRIRIGTSATHTTAFISGIRGVTTAVADAIPVLIDSAGQLGTVSSSIKYKENVELFDDSEVLYQLDPVQFNYTGQTKQCIGLIAEEVEDVYPEMCIYQINNDTNQKELLTVDYGRLPILMLAEMKKMRKELDRINGII
jgi:hypothetical protein